jgi:hypothetical protein
MSTQTSPTALMADYEVYIYNINTADRTRRLACMVPEQYTREHGLKSFTIVGEFTQGDAPEHFVVNPAYIEFLAWAIAKHAAHCPGILAQAEKQQDGNLIISDGRSRLNGAEFTEDDIIGYVEVKNGQLIRYAGNKNYRPLTEHGFTKMEPWLNKKIREELIAQVQLGEDIS